MPRRSPPTKLIRVNLTHSMATIGSMLRITGVYTPPITVSVPICYLFDGVYAVYADSSAASVFFSYLCPDYNDERPPIELLGNDD
jgi:hypothetical protein